jgi:hypothetical protein
METEIPQFAGAKNGTHLIECMNNNESFNCNKLNLTFIGASKLENIPQICKQQILSKVINGKPYLFNPKIKQWEIWAGFEERQ